MVRGFFLIFCCWGLGEAIAQLLQLPIPGPVLGMLAMWSALQFKWLPYEAVQPVARGFLSIMGIFFLPPSLGILLHVEAFNKYLWPILFTVVLSSIVSGLVTALTFKLLDR
jgi:holin-like protein